jgi:hypothetical protein
MHVGAASILLTCKYAITGALNDKPPLPPSPASSVRNILQLIASNAKIVGAARGKRGRRVDAAAAIKFHPEHTHHIIDLGHTWVLQQGRRRLANLERLVGWLGRRRRRDCFAPLSALLCVSLSSSLRSLANVCKYVSLTSLRSRALAPAHSGQIKSPGRFVRKIWLLLVPETQVTHARQKFSAWRDL